MMKERVNSFYILICKHIQYVLFSKKKKYGTMFIMCYLLCKMRKKYTYNAYIYRRTLWKDTQATIGWDGAGGNRLHCITSYIM